MVRQNGMLMMAEIELERIMDFNKRKIEELETRNKMLQAALMELVGSIDVGNKEVRVSKADFLEIYNNALNEMFDNPDEENKIYGHNVSVHWHGIYCNCGDGATPSNHIIPAIQSCYEEDGEEW